MRAAGDLRAFMGPGGTGPGGPDTGRGSGGLDHGLHPGLLPRDTSGAGAPLTVPLPPARGGGGTPAPDRPPRSEPPVARTAVAAGTVFGALRRVGALSLSWHAGLWIVMVLVSVAVLSSPGAPVAVRAPLLAVSVGTTVGVVGLALAQLGTLRFMVFGRPLDLYAGLGFGALAVANLVVNVLGPLGFLAGLAPEVSGYLILFARSCAGLLFLLGLLARRLEVRPDSRSERAWRAGTLVAMTLLLGGAAIVSLGSALSDPVDPRAYALLARGEPVLGSLPGQSAALLTVNGSIALLLLLAAVGYVGLWLRLGDPHVGWLAAALGLLFFGQLHTFLFPPVAANYVATADGFRLAAFLVLLFGLVSRLTGEIAERSSRDERLRLSRELHDGLAQQLGLLNLRLSRATAPGRPESARARDLDTAKRLVEAASLEARQAITALRTGSVTWEDLTRTVGAFVEEFATNHEVEVRLAAHGSVPRVEADIQAEVLRILHESLSNALRHGGATAIEASLVAHPDGILEVRVQDDGAGFHPEPALAGGSGVGLRSISERLERRGGTLLLESAPGQGTTVRAMLPLPGSSARG